MIDPAERRSALWTFAVLAGASLAFVVFCVYRLSTVWPLTSPPRGAVTPAAATSAARIDEGLTPPASATTGRSP